MTLCFFLIWGPAGYSQELESLPKLEPSYSNHFYQKEASYASKCFENALLDKKGRLWLSPCAIHLALNSVGLLQFDGYRFLHIDVTDGENSTRTIYILSGINRAGQLFGLAGSPRQIFFADPDSRETEWVDLKGFRQWSPDNIIETASGHFILLGNNSHLDSIGLFTLQNGDLKKQATISNPNANKLEYRTRAIVETSQDIWFMSVSFPLYRYDKRRKKIIAYHLADFPGDIIEGNPNPNIERLMPAIVSNGSDGIYLHLPKYYGDKLYRFDRLEDRFYSIVSEFPASWTPKGLYEDQTGNVCFLFQDAKDSYRAVIQDTLSHRFNYSSIVHEIGNIKKMVARDFFQQVFMVGNQGLYSVSVRQSQVIGQALAGKWVSSMMQLPDGQVLVNTVFDKWYLLDPEGGSALPFAGISCGLDPSPFGPGMKQQIQKDASGNLWFLSGAYLVRYDPVAQSCLGFDLEKEFALFCFVGENTVVLSDKSDQLAYYDLASRSFHSFGPNIPRRIPAKIRDLLVDSRGLLWIPTNQGLWKVDLEKEISEIVALDTDVRFAAIYETTDGKIWLGTYFDGVVIFDPDTGSTRVINQQQGLSNNSVMSIIGDDEGYIWAATEYGITLLSPEGTVMSELHEEDGLSSEIFERFDPYKDEQGRLYFGSRNGINFFDPKKYSVATRPSTPPRIYLTELSFYDQKKERDVVQLHDLEQPPVLDLPADHRYLRLNYALTSYIEPDRNRYAYRLEGIHEGWIYLGAQHELILNQLPTGTYRLLIKGADYQNNWTETPLAIRIHARDFFYKQVWFYTSLFGILAFVVFFWIRRLRSEKARLETEVQKRTRQIQFDKELIQQQAEELTQLDQLKSRFFTNISHELRTPITLITAPVEQLLRKSAGRLENGIVQSLQLVLNNGRKLLHLVETLLDLSRLESDNIRLKETPTHPAVFCRHIFHRFSPVAEGARVDFQFCDRWPLGAGGCWLDRARLETIISNLLSNALKFTPPRGQVQLNLEKEADRMLIQVKDTGRGIPPEDIPHIFDRYFQSKNATLLEAGGTGIGLALAAELTRLMQGTLTVESEWRKGSIFTLSLPFRPAVVKSDDADAGSLPQAVAGTASQKPVLNPKTAIHSAKKGKQRSWILIVEDNTDMQQLLTGLLIEDFHCLVAANGREAMALLTDLPPTARLPSVIISDIMMPQMDGYALLAQLKDKPGFQRIPIIMLTSKSGEQDKLRALRMGVDDYLTKPFTPEELQLRVNRLISNARQRETFLQSDQTIEQLPLNADQSWLQQLESAAIHALDQKYGLSKAFLAHEMALSERQLLRRLKALTGLTIHQYILEIKLQKGRRLLEKRPSSAMEEVARACGFSSAGYFTKVYKNHFGKRPGR